MKKNENKENENVKITNVNVIIAKLEAEREELLQLIYTDFVNYNIAKQLKTHRLKMLYTFIKDFVNNSFLIKKELYVYDKESEDFKIYDKEMFAVKVESVSDTFNLYIKELKQKRNGDVETTKQYAINSKKFFNYLKINAENIKNINVSINVFNKKTKFFIDKENKEAVLIKNKIVLKEPNYNVLRATGEKKKTEILKDYKKLWDGGEKLFDVLDFIIFGRFLSARKELQLNINAPSSWEKGFLWACLKI